MKPLILVSLTLFFGAYAYADYLECANNQEQTTEIGFYNNFGKISFQLSAPYNNEYIYEIGNCFSDNESGIGLPYTCEAAAGSTDVVNVNLIKDQSGQPAAQLTTKFDDGSSTTELISCEHFNR